MKEKVLQKYTEAEIKAYLADKDEEYIRSFTGNKFPNKDFSKEIAKRIEPLWKDIYDYENGNIFKRLRVYIKSLLLNKKGTCNVPYDVIESLAATFLPDIQAFFESEEGKKEFDEWKEQQKLKEALDDMNSNHMFTIEQLVIVLKQNPTKKQHYVPQVYLRGFSSDKSKINAYWIDNNIDERYIPIDSICRENYLYELRNDSNDLIATNHIEKCLSALEGMFSEYRIQLLNKAYITENYKTKCFFTSQEKVFWKLFIAIQMLRTPKVLNEAKIFSEDFFGESLKRNSASNIVLGQLFPFFQEAKPGDVNCLFSFIEPMQNMSMALGVDFNSRIITSDNPVYAYSPDKTIQNFEKIIFPINDQLVIFLFGGELQKLYDKNRAFRMDEDDADSVIQSIAYSADNIVFSKYPISQKDKQLIISARKDKFTDEDR